MTGSTPGDRLPVKLRQVLLDLLGNAVKFTARGGVRLAVRPGPGRVTFEVRDTGPGLAPEHLSRIREPFWQAERPQGEASGGTGLGLGITRRLVRLLGGEVRVESEPGRGSLFAVDLAAGRRGPQGGAAAPGPRNHIGNTSEWNSG